MAKSKSKSKSAKEGEKFVDELDSDLTPEELEQRKDRIVQICVEIDRVEADKTQAMSGYNADLKALRKERTSLIENVKTGQAKKQVECYERFVFETNTVETVRADTDEVVDSRPMEADERHELAQGGLFEEGDEPGNVSHFPPGAKAPSHAEA